MDGIHDLGGMHGFGPIEAPEDEPLFEARWQRRVFGLSAMVLGGVVRNVDKFRHAIERMPPAEYLTAGYYGRWLASLETVLLDEGHLEVDELEGRRGSLARGESPPPAAEIRAEALGEASAVRELATPPRFVLGQAVRARNLHPPGHTRLPRYVRGKRGVVVEAHRGFVFPDANAHDRGECPQHLYSVAFAGFELWGEDAEDGTTVSVDLFESYLEPAE